MRGKRSSGRRPPAQNRPFSAIPRNSVIRHVLPSPWQTPPISFGFYNLFNRPIFRRSLQTDRELSTLLPEKAFVHRAGCLNRLTDCLSVPPLLRLLILSSLTRWFRRVYCILLTIWTLLCSNLCSWNMEWTTISAAVCPLYLPAAVLVRSSVYQKRICCAWLGCAELLRKPDALTAAQPTVLKHPLFTIEV